MHWIAVRTQHNVEGVLEITIADSAAGDQRQNAAVMGILEQLSSRLPTASGASPTAQPEGEAGGPDLAFPRKRDLEDAAFPYAESEAEAPRRTRARIEKQMDANSPGMSEKQTADDV